LAHEKQPGVSLVAEGGGSALKGQRLGISPADVPQSGIAGQRVFARASQPHWLILEAAPPFLRNVTTHKSLHPSKPTPAGQPAAASHSELWRIASGCKILPILHPGLEI